MASEIKMPQLSDTMYSGKILAWRKQVGDKVARGDNLAEVETDKANLEIESFHVGTLLSINIPAGETADVGDVIAVLGEPGEKVADTTPKPQASPQPQSSQAEQSNATSRHDVGTPQNQAPLSPRQDTPPLHVVQRPTAAAPSIDASTGTSERVKISPLARKVAEQRNIAITGIQGSGPNGRIVKSDIDRAGSSAPKLSETPRSHPMASANAAPSPVPASGRLTPFSKMRETIARRMQESVTQAPHFYVTTSIEMSQAKKLRELLKERSEFKGISINHLIIKAVAYGIEREPRVNNTVKENQLYEPGQINVGIITAVDDGLLIPVIKEANLLSLKDIVFEARAAVERARAGRPNSSDLTGGTFSISNMGMFDVESFTAIINPGQGSVLAVSSIQNQPIVSDGTIVVGSVMKATISVDHRIIDGVMAGTFLRHFKEALENPALLTLPTTS